jgi:hypothetical protein
MRDVTFGGMYRGDVYADSRRQSMEESQVRAWQDKRSYAEPQGASTAHLE